MQSHQNPYGGYGAYGQQSGVVQPQQTTPGYPYASAPAPPAQQPVTGYGQSAYTATAADPYGQQSYAQQGGAYSATGATYQQDASQQAAQGFAGAAGQQQYGAEYQQYQAAQSAETSYAAYGTAQTQVCHHIFLANSSPYDDTRTAIIPSLSTQQDHSMIPHFSHVLHVS
jgi:hypothetical protein